VIHLGFIHVEVQIEYSDDGGSVVSRLSFFTSFQDT
jgi:hypothetical protein